MPRLGLGRRASSDCGREGGRGARGEGEPGRGVAADDRGAGHRPQRGARGSYGPPFRVKGRARCARGRTDSCELRCLKTRFVLAHAAREHVFACTYPYRHRGTQKIPHAARAGSDNAEKPPQSATLWDRRLSPHARNEASARIARALRPAGTPESTAIGSPRHAASCPQSRWNGSGSMRRGIDVGV